MYVCMYVCVYVCVCKCGYILVWNNDISVGATSMSTSAAQTSPEGPCSPRLPLHGPKAKGPFKRLPTPIPQPKKVGHGTPRSRGHHRGCNVQAQPNVKGSQ